MWTSLTALNRQPLPIGHAIDHEFVAKLGDGTLPQAAFRSYLVQDYLFLIQFARAWGLAAYKSRTIADIRAA